MFKNYFKKKKKYIYLYRREILKRINKMKPIILLTLIIMIIGGGHGLFDSIKEYLPEAINQSNHDLLLPKINLEVDLNTFILKFFKSFKTTLTGFILGLFTIGIGGLIFLYKLSYTTIYNFIQYSIINDISPTGYFLFKMVPQGFFYVIAIMISTSIPIAIWVKSIKLFFNKSEKSYKNYLKPILFLITLLLVLSSLGSAVEMIIL